MQRSLTVVLLLGCASQHASDDAQPPQGASERPSHHSMLQITGGGAPVSSWTFADTGIGQRAASTFVIRNVGSAATAPLALATTTPELTLVTNPAPCDGRALVPGDYCFATLAYQPTAVGDLHATLHITGAASDPALPVHGRAITPSGGLIANMTMLDFGLVETGAPARADVLLENISGSNISISSLTATGGFEVIDNTCPQPLTSGDACRVTLAYITQTANTAGSGAFTATSDANDVTVSLSSLSVRRVVVGRTGTGSGIVTSSPGGMTCADFCSGLYLGAVTLTARPDPGSLLGAWFNAFQADCHASDCAVPDGGAVALGVRFELTSIAKAVSITFSGAGSGGRVSLTNDSAGEYVSCLGACTVYYAPGAQVRAAVTTPEVFVGWKGACTGTDPHCDFGTIVHDRNAIATVALDDREVRTLLPSVPTDRIAYAPDGDLVVAGARMVAKLAPTGELRWSLALDGPANAQVLGISVAPNGDVLHFRADDPSPPTTLQLSRISAAGALQWARTFPSAQQCPQPYGGGVAVAPNGDAAILAVIGGLYTLAVFDAANTPRWTATDLRDCRAVAIDAGGVYHVADDQPDFTSEVRRYSADGTRLVDQGAIAPTDSNIEQAYSIAVDANGNLAAHVSDTETHTVSLLTSAGTLAFADQAPTPCCGGQYAVGVAFDASGNVIAARDADMTMIVPGFHLDQWSPTGTLLWSFDKPGFDQIPYDASNLFSARAIATDNAHHVSIAGNYNGGPWIETFVMP